MRRSADFSHTVKHGVRASQPDVVVHGCRVDGANDQAPKVGFIVSKSVGGAVDRHRVARRLRHAARTVIGELEPSDRIVVRALPGSRYAESARLAGQLHVGVRRVHDLMEQRRVMDQGRVMEQPR